MSSNKDLAIKEITKEFEKLSNLVLGQLDKLNNIFETYKNDGPSEISKKIIKGEKKINKSEVKLDDKIIKTIVLYKPVASDLRELFAIYRMVINLERIGDLVIKVSDLIFDIKESDLLKNSLSKLHEMLKLSQKIVNTSLISFLNKDKESALWVLKQEDNIKELSKKIIKSSITKEELPADTEAFLTSLVELKSILSSIERIGGHASNIAEISLYALLGINIRHQNIDTKNI